MRKRIWYSPPCSFLPHQYGRIDEHILDKDTVANGGIVDQDVRHHTPLCSVASLLRKHCAPTILPF